MYKLVDTYITEALHVGSPGSDSMGLQIADHEANKPAGWVDIPDDTAVFERGFNGTGP